MVTLMSVQCKQLRGKGLYLEGFSTVYYGLSNSCFQIALCSKKCLSCRLAKWKAACGNYPALLESESVICQSLCLCVMSSKKASVRPLMQPMRALRKAILTHSLERKLNASWYFSLHASPFVSFNYSLVVNKLISCWCFINHSDCYDNMFVCSSLLQR